MTDPETIRAINEAIKQRSFCTYTPKRKRTYTPYNKRIKKKNLTLNPDNPKEGDLIQLLAQEPSAGGLVKELLIQHYNI